MFDFNVVLVFILTLLSLILCIIYGVINWRKEGKSTEGVTDREIAWSQEERKIEDELSGEGQE